MRKFEEARERKILASAGSQLDRVLSIIVISSSLGWRFTPYSLDFFMTPLSHSLSSFSCFSFSLSLPAVFLLSESAGLQFKLSGQSRIRIFLVIYVALQHPPSAILAYIFRHFVFPTVLMCYLSLPLSLRWSRAIVGHS